MIRIALVDDHEVVRQGLVSFLSSVDDFDLVAQGSNGAEALTLVAETKPDLLILDMILPDMTGLAVFEKI
jgi:YesN/AraC family two-component response regulator